MNATKEKILASALELFNAEGYFNVRMRAIADASGLSVGNLTYHFKKKPEILWALYEQMTAIFDARLAEAPTTQASLAHMQSEIERSMRIMLDYRFFWLETIYILQEEAQIANHFKKAYQLRLQGMELYLGRLVEAGELRAPRDRQDHALVAKHMISFSNNWIMEMELSGASASAQSVKEKSGELMAYLQLYR